MTLFKQISLIMSVFLLFVLISVMTYNFQSAKRYAQEELATTAQNTASYLSLSLANANGEVSAMSSMINAVFDSGDFQRITLKDINNKIIFQRTNVKEYSQVPSWFTSMYTLEVPSSSATVSSGWNPIGSIKVNPMQENTHIKLYNNFLDLLQSFIFFALLSFTLLFFVLRLILNSLKDMVNQAEAVSNNNFIINDNIPNTTEFKEVTLAMNKMVTKVKNIFDKEAQSVKQYHKLLYTDLLTGFGNRNFFELKLSEYISSDGSDSNGFILNVFLDGIIKANQSLGHEKVDTLIKDLSLVITKETQNKKCICTRIGGTKFSIIFTHNSSYDIEVISENILAEALILLEKCDSHCTDCSVKLTCINYGVKDKVLLLLDTIEKTLLKVEKNSIFLTGCKLEKQSSLTKEVIQKRINEQQVALAIQEVQDKDAKSLHCEAYVRLYDDENEVHTAGDFIGLVHDLKLDTRLDKNVINYVLKNEVFQEKEVAINLSLAFIQDPSSLKWLKERLLSSPRSKPLSFEISNHHLLSAVNAGLNLANTLDGTPHHFAIDRFSIDDASNLNYLQILKPSYLKMDSAYLVDMIKGEEGNTNPALQILSESIDSKIIATNIEDKETRDFLESVGIDYFQGSFISDTVLI